MSVIGVAADVGVRLVCARRVGCEDRGVRDRGAGLIGMLRSVGVPALWLTRLRVLRTIFPDVERLFNWLNIG
jgi:hypothetical protein